MSSRRLGSIFRTALTGLALMVAGCTLDSKTGPYSGISPEFTEYVNRFVAEAKARNVQVDLGKLSIQFVSTGNFCGYVRTGGPPYVQIKQTDYCWNTKTDEDKEILIFHELGNVILKRPTDNSTLPNGRQKSIMSSDFFFGSYIKFTPQLRKYYLDELFDPSTPAPAWSAVKTNTREIFKDPINAEHGWTYDNTSASLTLSGAVNSSIYSTPSYSLSLVSTLQGPSGYAYWYKSISPAGIAPGTEVELSVKIRMDNISGSGASMSIRAQSGTEVAILKTLSDLAINGSIDFTEYKIKIQYFPEQVDDLVLMLQLYGASSGTVYFDDVRVINNY